MWHDVVDLRDFYETRLGAVTRRVLRREIRALWPNVAGQRVLGLGYATPYLRQFLPEAERVFALMPSTKGVVHWPAEGRGRGLTALVDEAELPLPESSIDRVLMVHGLESSEAQRDMLREVWRVLTGDGRLLVVAPNRGGIWARLERTPLGWGEPYSSGQLSRLLRDNMFTPTRSSRALPDLRRRGRDRGRQAALRRQPSGRAQALPPADRGAVPAARPTGPQRPGRLARRGPLPLPFAVQGFLTPGFL